MTKQKDVICSRCGSFIGDLKFLDNCPVCGQELFSEIILDINELEGEENEKG